MIYYELANPIVLILYEPKLLDCERVFHGISPVETRKSNFKRKGIFERGEHRPCWTDIVPGYVTML